MTALVRPAGSQSQAARRIRDVILRADAAAPRHRQQSIGPSEIGQRCDRSLTYRALAVEPVANNDPWSAIIGTAVHAWLADAYARENNRLGHERYLIERRVWLTDGIGGTCDLYDIDTAEVIDHKVLGAESMRKIRTGDILPDYRAQVHLYGYGYTRAGYPVERVCIAAYPRGGFLDGIEVWSEPYDEGRALDALDRLSHLVAVASVLNLDQPDSPLWSLIPAAPSDRCMWCPWWRPGRPVDGSGCPGPT